VSETRRHALKILGTVTATCAFPFASEELYGQHVMFVPGQTPAAGPYKPSFFTADEYAALSRLADVIIPETDTPGASRAGVPEYIDRVVTANKEHQPLARAGLAWLAAEARTRFSKDYLSLDESQHTALLQPLSDAVDQEAQERQQTRYRSAPGGRIYYVAVTDAAQPARPAVAVRKDASDAGMPVSFFRLIKNLTADGYYTSRVGLLEELGYGGNKYLPGFPQCTVPEH
jgi:glucoside 3-dehydrogenase (cytochrome c) hitch-hiker subunit